MVGQNLKYEVGTVVYTRDEGSASSNTGAIIGATISVVVVLGAASLLIFVLFFYFFKRRNVSKDILFSNRQEMIETKKSESYCFCTKILIYNLVFQLAWLEKEQVATVESH